MTTTDEQRQPIASLWPGRNAKASSLPNPLHKYIGSSFTEHSDSLPNFLRLQQWRRRWKEVMGKVHDKFNLKTNREP